MADVVAQQEYSNIKFYISVFRYKQRLREDVLYNIKYINLL